MTKILHISTHLGGGVGRVLTGYLKNVKTDHDFEHQIYCLDYINDSAKKLLNESGTEYQENAHENIQDLLNAITKTDIVVIHWWNHPLLLDLLVRYELPPCRVAIWSHISGNQPPNIFSVPLLDYPDLFVFTTPMSYLVDEVANYADKARLKDIWSTGGLDHIRDVVKNEHDSFNIGYIGTVDYAKMYSNFVDMCAKIDIPNVRFIICGDGSQLEEMKQDVKSRGLDERFVFTGFINNISDYLSTFDIFAYALSSEHYGTCDQALAEAMGCGIVPVVFDNNMEKYMVSQCGMVVASEDEYISSIMKLYAIMTSFSNTSKTFY